MTDNITFNPTAIFAELLDEAPKPSPVAEPDESDDWASIGDGCYIRSTSYTE